MLSENSEWAIDLNGVGKLFYKQEQRTFKEFIPALITGKRTGEWFWALKDIHMQIKKGETVGIVGSNGSGKSTLLKLIAGVSQPTEGKLTVHGRVAPLIELGAGFHPELTGRENVYLNGVILGMSRKEIDRKFKDIVDFAELWDFIDQPVKHYSSGMYLRLGFSVAVHTDPEILLIDEILAVGDQPFQAKCLEKMRDFKKKNVTIVMVSHSLDMVKAFCTKCVLLHNGCVVTQGSTQPVLQKYISTFNT